MFRSAFFFLLAVAVAVFVGYAAGWDPDALDAGADSHGETVKASAETVSISLRDGVNLAGSLWLPDGPGPHPVVVQRTPYDRLAIGGGSTTGFMNAKGVAVLVIDVRGRYGSEGVWDPWFHEGRDGQDVLTWVDSQQWCNGMIATMGGSYEGAVQLFAAALGTPELDAMAPLVTPPSSPFENLPFDGGPYVSQQVVWAVMMRDNTVEPPPSNPAEELLDIFASYPINRWDDAFGRPTPWFDTWLSHWRLDGYWLDRMFDPELEAVQVPTLLVTGWFDGNRPGSIRTFQTLSRHQSATVREGVHLTVGPWGHNAGYQPSIGELEFPSNAERNPGAVRNQWLVDRLSGVAAHGGPTIEYYLMGRNEWLQAASWPPSATARRRYHLVPGGGLSKRVSRPSSESYVYDPGDPTPIVEPIPMENFGLAFGHFPIDVSGILARGDTLVYQTDPLVAPVAIAGPVSAVLHFESSAEDTDVGAHMVDLTPDGRAISLAHGMSRLRFRNGYDTTAPLEPYEIAEVEVDLWSIAYEFEVGHRIGLIVSSAQFPAFDAHRNVYDDLATGTNIQVATQTLHLGRRHPSRLVVYELLDRPRSPSRVRPPQ